MCNFIVIFFIWTSGYLATQSQLFADLSQTFDVLHLGQLLSEVVVDL